MEAIRVRIGVIVADREQEIRDAIKKYVLSFGSVQGYTKLDPEDIQEVSAASDILPKISILAQTKDLMVVFLESGMAFSEAEGGEGEKGKVIDLIQRKHPSAFRILMATREEINDIPNYLNRDLVHDYMIVKPLYDPLRAGQIVRAAVRSYLHLRSLTESLQSVEEMEKKSGDIAAAVRKIRKSISEAMETLTFKPSETLLVQEKKEENKVYVLAEDETEKLVLEETLKSLGLEAEFFSDITALLNRLRAAEPRGIVVDGNSQDVRIILPSTSSKILLITAEEKPKISEPGRIALLFKPFTLKQLQFALGKLGI